MSEKFLILNLGNVMIGNGSVVSIGLSQGQPPIVIQGCLSLNGSLNLTLMDPRPIRGTLLLPLFSLPSSCSSGTFSDVHVTTDNPCLVATYGGVNTTNPSLLQLILIIPDSESCQTVASSNNIFFMHSFWNAIVLSAAISYWKVYEL
jgi:hypothetical protein